MLSKSMFIERKAGLSGTLQRAELFFQGQEFRLSLEVYCYDQSERY